MNENYFEKENQKRKIEKKEQTKEKTENMKRLEKLFLKNNIKLSLQELKKLVQEKMLDMDIVEKFFDAEKLENIDITTIFDKIDEIENIQKIDEILPKEFRIDKAEYLLALQDPNIRQQVQQKIEDILTFVALNFNGEKSGFGIVFFYFSTLDKNLIKIQENTIDMKDFLEVNRIK